MVVAAVAGLIAYWTDARWFRQLIGGSASRSAYSSDLFSPDEARALPAFTSPARSEVSEDEAEVAREVNAATPANSSAIMAARTFVIDPSATPLDRQRAQQCLAMAIYYEAASESVAGQRAVAQVVLNRVRHPIFPKTVCDVVFQGASRITGCQFTFTCDGSLKRAARGPAWIRAQQLASDALNGYVELSVGTATHYHADWVAPWWRTSLTKLTTIGVHIFYRWQGSTGGRTAFARRYGGSEPDPAGFYVPEALPGETPPPEAAKASESEASFSRALAAGPPVIPLGADGTRQAPSADDHGSLVVDENAGQLKE